MTSEEFKEKLLDEKRATGHPVNDPQKPMKYFDIRMGRPVGVADATADMLFKAYLGSFNAAAEQGANSQGCVQFAVVQVALVVIQLLIEQGAVEVKA